MTAPIVTPDTTLRELGEILRRDDAPNPFTISFDEVWWVLTDDGWHSGPDLAAAINAALVKAGAR